jgi:hypothetical protein
MVVMIKSRGKKMSRYLRNQYIALAIVNALAGLIALYTGITLQQLGVFAVALLLFITSALAVWKVATTKVKE